MPDSKQAAEAGTAAVKTARLATPHKMAAINDFDMVSSTAARKAGSALRKHNRHSA
jgi:hypothetical protein